MTAAAICFAPPPSPFGQLLDEAAEKVKRFIQWGIALLATVYTSAGEAFTADIFDGTIDNNGNTPFYIAWGTGTTGAAKGDTALETESAEARTLATKSQPSADINRFVGTIVATGTRAITEAGVLTASSSGTLIIRSVFSAINLVSGDSIAFTINLEWT